MWQVQTISSHLLIVAAAVTPVAMTPHTAPSLFLPRDTELLTEIWKYLHLERLSELKWGNCTFHSFAWRIFATEAREKLCVEIHQALTELHSVRKLSILAVWWLTSQNQSNNGTGKKGEMWFMDLLFSCKQFVGFMVKVSEKHQPGVQKKLSQSVCKSPTVIRLWGWNFASSYERWHRFGH